MDDWLVQINVRGRGGTIAYSEGPNTAYFEWELGGGDSIAIVTGPPPQEWDLTLPWARDRRREILRRIADHVIRTRAPTSRAEFVDDDTAFVLRKGDPAK